MAKRSRQRGIPHKARQSIKPAVRQVVIGVPTQDQCQSTFAYDLAQLVGYSQQAIPALQMQLLFSYGTLIAPQREDIVKASLKAGATHILWLDSDMRFPKQTLEGLLRHEQDIVAANYTKRRPPHMPTAHAQGVQVFTYDNSEGLVPVDHVGMGAMLTSTDVFKKIPRPWFTIDYDHGSELYISEDVSFLRRANLAGFIPYIDQELSKYVTHTGQMEYNYMHSLDAKEHLERVAEGDEDGSDNGLRIVKG